MRDLLHQKRLFIFDVEGVLCDNIDYPTPTKLAGELLSCLKDAGKRVLVMTNISRKSSTIVIDKLNQIGLRLRPSEVLTAGEATAAYILEKYKGARCFVISEGGLTEDLQRNGICPVSEEPVDVVVVGANRKLTYSELNFAARSVLNGAELVCAGTSPIFRGTFQGDEGVFVGEAAITEAIKFSTGRSATYIGKPYPEIFEKALKLNEATPNDAVMFGDNLKSDISGAKNVGITTVYVSKNPLPSSISEVERPDFIVKDLEEFYNAAFI